MSKRLFVFGALAPKVAIIENLFQDPRYVDFMKSRGYELWRVLEPNDVYLLTSSATAETQATAITQQSEQAGVPRGAN